MALSQPSGRALATLLMAMMVVACTPAPANTRATGTGDAARLAESAVTLPPTLPVATQPPPAPTSTITVPIAGPASPTAYPTAVPKEDSAEPTDPPPTPTETAAGTTPAPTEQSPSLDSPPPTPTAEDPTPTAPQTVEVTWSVSPALLAAAEPQIYETTITIPTYDYERAFVSTTENDPVYPYPRLDMGQVGPPSPRAYRAVVLENGFVSLTILPELGGRIYRWVDKATGETLLYENPVVKPTSWGYRGWWLAAGGIEWAFPVEEHGLNEYRPWQVSTGSSPYGLAVTVSDVDSRTGMEVGATISLDAGHAYVTLQPWARNDTATAQPYQLWLNAMLALNGNSMSDETRLVIPAAEVTVHSTGDGGAAGSGAPMSWPVYNGRDMSRIGNWTGYLGFFAPNVTDGFTAVYDLAADQGVVRTYSPGWPAGTKLFGPGTLSPSLWTDDNSNYLELWSGATSSFWSNATLEPGQTFGWMERWYPVARMGGLSYANQSAAIRLERTADAVELRVAVPGAFTGQIALEQGGNSVGQWPVTLYPSQAFSATWPQADATGGTTTARLVDSGGVVAAETSIGP